MEEIMKVENLKSSLKLNSLYFSLCSLKRGANISSGDYDIDLLRSYSQIAEHEYNVSLRLEAKKEDFDLVVEANASFTFEGSESTNEEQMIRMNTIAIMYPYVRSQVTLMTAQPNMSPIVLPPINTTKLK